MWEAAGGEVYLGAPGAIQDESKYAAPLPVALSIQSLSLSGVAIGLML
jgi:hypothetical protein